MTWNQPSILSLQFALLFFAELSDRAMAFEIVDADGSFEIARSNDPPNQQLPDVVSPLRAWRTHSLLSQTGGYFFVCSVELAELNNLLEHVPLHPNVVHLLGFCVNFPVGLSHAGRAHLIYPPPPP